MFVKLSFSLAIVAFGLLCFGPTVATLGLSGAGRSSLLENQGSAVIIPLLIPVLLAALPLARLPAARKTTVCVVSAVLLSCFVVVGRLSIGMFYAPSAALMVIAAVRNRAG